MNNIQQSLLKQMKIIDSVCRQHEIQYSLHGGTLLGAVREKGFIPWDDDVDISMKRTEFNRFKTAVENSCTTLILRKWGGKYYIHDKNDKNGAWIDIFLYDYISEKSVARKLKILILTAMIPFVKNTDTIQVTKSGQYGKIKSFVYRVLYIMGRPFSDDSKFMMINNFGEKAFTGKKQLIHRSTDQYYAMKLCLDRDCMEEFLYVPFQDTELMVSTRYHDILVSLYGEDYMTPKPPEDIEYEIHALYRDLSKVN